MLNQVNIQGRLVADPEFGVTIHTANGDRTKYTFTIATEDEYGKKATYFIPCAAWGKTGEFVRKWFKKGYMGFFTGKLVSYKDFTEEYGGATKIEFVVDHVDFPSDKKKEEEFTEEDRPIEELEDRPF